MFGLLKFLKKRKPPRSMPKLALVSETRSKPSQAPAGLKPCEMSHAHNLQLTPQLRHKPSPKQALGEAFLPPVLPTLREYAWQSRTGIIMLRRRLSSLSV